MAVLRNLYWLDSQVEGLTPRLLHFLFWFDNIFILSAFFCLTIEGWHVRFVFHLELDSFPLRDAHYLINEAFWTVDIRMRKPLTSLQQPDQFLDRRDNILFNAVEAYHVTDGHVAIFIEFIVLAFIRALPKRAVILALIFIFFRFGADISDGEDALRFIVEV